MINYVSITPRVKKKGHIIKNITDVASGILRNIKATHRKWGKKPKQQKEPENKRNSIKGTHTKKPIRG